MLLQFTFETARSIIPKYKIQLRRKLLAHCHLDAQISATPWQPSVGGLRRPRLENTTSELLHYQ